MGFNQKTASFLSILALFSCFFGFLCILLFFGKSGPENTAQNAPSVPSSDMLVNGLSFTEYHENRKLFSFKAETFEISRKQIGFLRMGFVKEAALKNVQLRFYLLSREVPGVEKSDEGAPPNPPYNNPPAQDNTSPSPALEGDSGLESFFKNTDRLNTLKLERIKGLDLDGLEIEMLVDNQWASSIKSDVAHMDLKARSIVFSGNVSIRAANGNRLTCPHLAWNPKIQKLSTEGPYVLIKNGAIIKGKGLKCDPLLMACLTTPSKTR